MKKIISLIVCLLLLTACDGNSYKTIDADMVRKLVSENADITYLRHNSGVGRSLTYPEITYEDYEQKGHAKFCPHSLRQEYSVFGIGDFRTPCLVGRFANGSRAIDLRYHSYEILEGKPALEGLPSVYANEGEKAETLVITLKDTVYNFSVKLSV